SYLLIGFWFTDEEKAYAGRKAFIVNRIGDFGFLIGIFVLYNQTGSVNFAQLNTVALPLGVASVAALCLFIGATGKSAQLPLYIWLPDAMAGPTPVSAVIHGLHGEQDIRKMGGLKHEMPSTRNTFLIATIAITGILPISGFFSKDEILGQALHTRAFSFLTLTPNASSHLTWLGPLIYV